MASKEYHGYIKSDAWAQIRVELFLSRGRKCETCRSRKKLQVHHLTYKNFGNEEPEDLIILCEECHIKEHPDKIKKNRVGYKPVIPKKVKGKMSKGKKRRLEKQRKQEAHIKNIDRKKRYISSNFEKRDGVWYEKSA